MQPLAYRLVLPVLFAVAASLGLSSFCGFYVARDDARLLNKTSQVILVRDGNQTVLTMSNDFQGDVKEFAMVVPVPTVLRRDQIKLASATVFEKLDAYSGPRLVEYDDFGPCGRLMMGDGMATASSPDMAAVSKPEKSSSVTVEARYDVGEYDILILNAQESGALKKWLLDNGYKIPPGAEEVLDPYIKSGLKFFVAKVDVTAFEKGGFGNLRPLQISFESPRFMLPIRLGMANAEEFQDLIVYAFSKKGRIESTNYRTVESPTDLDVPTFVRDRFNDFYRAAWEKTWGGQKNALFLEYAWDLSSSNYLMCDPCAGDPPVLADLQDAGIPWVGPRSEESTGSADYEGDLYMTRLHLRYDRATFPQDLVFQETPNREPFQIRYVMHIPTLEVNCEGAGAYFKEVYERRVAELANLSAATGWDSGQYGYYTEEYRKQAEAAGMDVPSSPEGGSSIGGRSNLWVVLGMMALVIGIVFFNARAKK